MLCYFQMELSFLTVWDEVSVRDAVCEVLVLIRGAIRDKLSFTHQRFTVHLLGVKPVPILGTKTNAFL